MPIANVNMEGDKRVDALHDAEMKHQRQSIQSRIIVKDEEVRRSKVWSTMLRGDVASLQEQLSQKSVLFDKLSRALEDHKEQLVVMTKRCGEQEEKLKTQAREQANLKAELKSLNSVSQDSSKMLSEKLALTRELANLRPQLDHLRSQLSHQTDVLAEKLALERQVNTLEVELANEKRAAQRAMQRQENKGTEVEEELRQQMRELEKQIAADERAAKRNADKRFEREVALQESIADLRQNLEKEREDKARVVRELASEKRIVQLSGEKDAKIEAALQQGMDELRRNNAEELAAKNKLIRDLEREMAESRAQNEFLTERFGEMKAKLRETRQELKACRTELTEAHKSATSRAVEDAVAAAKAKKAKTQVARKRRAGEMTVENNVLQTPTQEMDRPKRPLKKRGLEALAGVEKSTFSITPFLTKTINFADGSVEFTAGGGDQKSTAVGGNDATVAIPAAPATVGDEDETEEAAEAEEAAAPASPTMAIREVVDKPTRKPAAVLKQVKPRGRPPKPKIAALRESPSSLQNMSILSSRNTSRGESTLKKVMEVEEADGDAMQGQENVPPAITSVKVIALKKAKASSTTAAKPKPKPKTKPAAVATTTEGTDSARSSSGASSTAAAAAEPEPKKKKRKLLGGATKTLFQDEDEGEALAIAAPPPAATAAVKRQPASKIQLGAAARGVGGLGKVPMAGGVAAVRKNAFTGKAFSPLKRDRRGVNASFLA